MKKLLTLLLLAPALALAQGKMPNVSADTTAFVELICTGTTIGSVYAKL